MIPALPGTRAVYLHDHNFGLAPSEAKAATVTVHAWDDDGWPLVIDGPSLVRATKLDGFWHLSSPDQPDAPAELVKARAETRLRQAVRRFNEAVEKCNARTDEHKAPLCHQLAGERENLAEFVEDDELAVVELP